MVTWGFNGIWLSEVLSAWIEIVIHQISLKIVLSIEMQIQRNNLFVEDVKCLISSNEIHV